MRRGPQGEYNAEMLAVGLMAGLEVGLGGVRRRDDGNGARWLAAGRWVAAERGGRRERWLGGLDRLRLCGGDESELVGDASDESGLERLDEDVAAEGGRAAGAEV